MSLFDGWVDAHGDEAQPERLQKMWKRYGAIEKQRCEDCSHLLELHGTRVHYKCQLSRITQKSDTDWRKGWMACGKFDRRKQR